MLSLEEVMDAIRQEMNYQNDKWGADKEQSLPGYFTVMRSELREAEDGWCKNLTGRHSPLSELTQAVTVGIRALMTYGVIGTAHATNDIALKYDRNGNEIIETTGSFGIALMQSYLNPSVSIDQANTAKDTRDPASNPVSYHETHNALSSARPSRVVTFTLMSGEPVHISKAVFVRAYSDGGTTTIVTLNGSIKVRESVHAVQAMIQD